MNGYGNKRKAFVLVALAVCAVVTLLLAELSFQLVHSYKAGLKGTALEKLVYHTEPPFSWERYFIRNNVERRGYMIPNMTQHGLHTSHPTRGWALKPNSVMKRGADTYTSNAQGFRSLNDFEYDPERYGILIVGDSFTFGDDIDDPITWPHLLGQLDTRLNVFNAGGSGYGVGQMYLTLKETIARYRPKLVIAAFIDNNLVRSTLAFRDYKKPRFVLEAGELTLTNTPVGSFDEVVAELRGKRLDNYSRIQTLNVINSITGRLRAKNGEPDGCSEDCIKLNERLFDEMRALAEENGAEFLMVYLPYDEEIVDRSISSYGERFFNDYSARHENHFLNPRPAMLAAPFRKSMGHYKEPENRLVSRLVYEKVRSLASWQRYSN